MTDNTKLLKYSLKVRNKGIVRFCLKEGIIIGLLNFIIINLLNLDEKSFVEIYFSLSGLLSLGFYLLAGILIYGPIMWWVNERTIRKINKSE